MTKARVTTFLALLLLAAAPRAAARQADARPLYRLALPEKSWALDLDLSAFNLPEGVAAAKFDGGSMALPASPVESLSEDGKDYQLAAFGRLEEKKPSSSVGVLIRMTPARAGAGNDAEAFRAFRLKNLDGREPVKVAGTKTWEYKQIPIARFTSQLSFPLGFGLGGTYTPAGPKMRTMEAYFVRDGVWITVGLMGIDLGEREEKLFYALLDSVKFADTSAPSTSFDYYHKGRLLFLRKDYRRAAEALAAALDLERRGRRLDTATWRALVGMLIDAYGGSAEFARAKEVMDYAAASDPANPLFQLVLARYSAALGDLDKTVEHLEKAFRLHAASGQSGPPFDPMSDRAFERFWKDERFRKAVKAIRK